MLTALTQLTYMQLPLLDTAVMPSEGDAAAVTAPPQLQVLDVSQTGLRAGACQHLFAAGQQLSQLTALRASLDLIPHGDETSLVAVCCPNLASIAFPVEPRCRREVDLVSMVEGWQSLQHLTSLTLNAGKLEMNPRTWGAVGSLAQLQKLEVRFALGVNIGLLEGILQLSSLQQMRVLEVECTFKYPSPPAPTRALYSYDQGPSSQDISLKVTSKLVRGVGCGLLCHMPV